MESFREYISGERLDEGVVETFAKALSKLKPVRNIIKKTYDETPRAVFLQLITIPLVSRMIERSSTDMFLKVADIVDSLRSLVMESDQSLEEE